MEKRLSQVDNMLLRQKEIDDILLENDQMKNEIKNLKNENDFLKFLFKTKMVKNTSNYSDNNSSTTINNDKNFSDTLESLKNY